MTYGRALRAASAVRRAIFSDEMTSFYTWQWTDAVDDLHSTTQRFSRRISDLCSYFCLRAAFCQFYASNMSCSVLELRCVMMFYDESTALFTLGPYLIVSLVGPFQGSSGYGDI